MLWNFPICHKMAEVKSRICMFNVCVVYFCIQLTFGGQVNGDYLEYVANGGSTVTFNCDHTHEKYDNITWYRNDSSQFVAQRGKDLKKYFDDNYTNRLNFDRETKNLIIFDCQGKDHGFYYCETMYRNEKLRGGNYKFIVEEKPKCNRVISDMNVLNGTSALLPCNVLGTPAPTYKWYKVVNNDLIELGDRFTSSEKGLFIRDVISSDAGTYQIKLENKIDTFFHTIQLNVKTLKAIASENYKSVPLGSHVIFNCAKSDLKEGTTIKWITSNGDDAILFDRFSISNKSSLLINQVQRKDDGLYTCKKRIKIGSGILTKSILVYLNVQYPPTIEVTESEVKVYKNSHVRIPCFAIGNPTPHYSWRFPDGKEMMSNDKYEILNNGSLIIRNVQVTDVMNYSCVPYNSVGDAKPGVTKLSVIVSPYFLRKSPEIIRARVGDDISINCSASGLPAPRVFWQNTNAKYSMDGKGTMIPSGLRTMKNVKRTDEGSYVCLAESSAGKSSHHIQIIILNKPDTPTDFYATTQNESMQFSWKPGYNGGAKQTYELWYRATYKNDYEWSSVAVISNRYVIRREDTNTAGTDGVSFYCSLRAENSEGYSDFSYVIKTSKLLPGAKKLSSKVLKESLSEKPLAPYDFTVDVKEEGYALQWKYVLTPGRPASESFVIEYQEENSTRWNIFHPKIRFKRSLNAAKGKQNTVNIKKSDIPGAKHPLKFLVKSVTSSNVKSAPALPIVRDPSVTAVTGKTTSILVDPNMIPPIVMGVIFGLFTVLIIIGLYCYCERKKKRSVKKESKVSLVASENNNIVIDRNSMDLRDSTKLLNPNDKDMPTRFHFSACPALKLGESSHSADSGQPDDVYVLLQPNPGEHLVCTCSKKYVTLNNQTKKRSLYKSSSLPSVLMTSDADVSSVAPSDIADGRDFGTIDNKKQGTATTLDKDAIARLQRGGLFRDSYDKFCHSGSKDAQPTNKSTEVDKRNSNKLAQAINSSPETPPAEVENILRRVLDDDNTETKSNKSIDGKSSGFGDGDSSTSDPDSIELDAFEAQANHNKETAAQLLNALAKKDTGYFSDVPTRVSPLFISNHKFHPIPKHKLGNKTPHSGYFSEDENVTRLPYRPSQPPSYNQAIIDIERLTESNDITDSENMCQQLLEMERQMGVKLDDSIDNNLNKIVLDPPCRFQPASYLDSGYMSDVTGGTLKSRYSNKEKNERCAQLLNEFKNNRSVDQLNFSDRITEEELPPPGSTPKHIIAKSIDVIDSIILEEPIPSLKKSNSTNSNLFNEWLV